MATTALAIKTDGRVFVNGAELSAAVNDVRLNIGHNLTTATVTFVIDTFVDER